MFNEMIIWFLSFVYVVVFIYQLIYVESSPHLWDEIYLFMVDNIFDVLLDSVC